MAGELIRTGSGDLVSYLAGLISGAGLRRSLTDVSREPLGAVARDEFGRLVDEFVTPPMLSLGYLRIGLFPRGPSDGRRHFAVGYEAATQEVRGRVLPGDPQSADEAWLYYDPDSDRLDIRFSAFDLATEVLCEQAAKDTTSVATLEHWLSVLAHALEGFARTIEER